MDCYITYTGILNKDTILGLVESGCTGIRLIYKEMSLQTMISRINDLSDILSKTNTKIMVDLPGSKPRLGSIANPINLSSGDHLTLTVCQLDIPSNAVPLVNLQPSQFSRIMPGHRIWLCDGALEFVVDQIIKEKLLCHCVGGQGTITSARSVVFPDSGIRYSSFSSVDEEFLQEATNIKSIEEIAISFVETPAIIHRARNLLRNSRCKFIAKIESPVPMADLKAIASASDKILLGRGDFITSVPYCRLYPYQEAIISLCQQEGISLMIATGILSTLAISRRPSIAECIDLSYLFSRGIKAFLIADEVSVFQPQRAIDAFQIIRASSADNSKNSLK